MHALVVCCLLSLDLKRQRHQLDNISGNCFRDRVYQEHWDINEWMSVHVLHHRLLRLKKPPKTGTISIFLDWA